MNAIAEILERAEASVLGATSKKTTLAVWIIAPSRPNQKHIIGVTKARRNDLMEGLRRAIATRE